MGDFDRVLVARDTERPTGLQFFSAIFSEFMELHGDRRYGDDPAIVGGIGRLNGMVVTAICTEKGRSTREKVRRNFGSAHPEGYRKALRLMKQAEKFRRPIITLIDTPGAYPGMEAEERGQSNAIAENLYEMSRLTVPMIAVITGEGNSGGALALAVADRVLMQENAVYSILSPEGFASILWKDATRHEEACELMKLTAANLLEQGIIDEIIAEPKGGAHLSPELAFHRMDEALEKNLNMLQKSSGSALTAARYQKFRKMGNELPRKENL